LAFKSSIMNAVTRTALALEATTALGEDVVAKLEVTGAADEIATAEVDTTDDVAEAAEELGGAAVEAAAVEAAADDAAADVVAPVAPPAT